MKKICNLLILFFTVHNLFAEKINFSADTMSGRFGKTNEKTVLEGNAYIKTETLEINAEKIELSGEDFNLVKAESHVQGKNLESGFTFECDRLEYNRISKVAFLSGKITMIDSENEVKACSEKLQYYQDSDTAILQVNVNILQKENQCQGAFAIYKKNEKLLTLTGNASVKQNDDVLRAQEIILNLETEELKLDGKIRGSITDDSQKKENPPKKNETENNAEENNPKNITDNSSQGNSDDNSKKNGGQNE